MRAVAALVMVMMEGSFSLVFHTMVPSRSYSSPAAASPSRHTPSLYRSSHVYRPEVPMSKDSGVTFFSAVIENVTDDNDILGVFLPVAIFLGFSIMLLCWR